jgi:hypothetical protein
MITEERVFVEVMGWMQQLGAIPNRVLLPIRDHRLHHRPLLIQVQ